MLVAPKLASSFAAKDAAAEPTNSSDTPRDGEIRMYRRQSTAEDLLRKLDRLNIELEGTMNSMGATLSLAENIRKDAGNLIASWFSNLHPSELSEKINQTFDKFDYKKTGVLDREEFHNAFASMGKRLASGELDVLITDFDTSGDGTIDREEFEHMIRTELKSHCKLTCKSCKLLRKRSSSAMDAISQRAAVIIQKLVRGMQARKLISSRRKAACVIQKVYRGRIIRKQVKTIRFAKAEIERAAKSKQTVISRDPIASRAKMIASSVEFRRTASSGGNEERSSRRISTGRMEQKFLQSDRKIPQVNKVFLSLSVIENEKQNRTRQLQSMSLFRNNSDITDQLVHNNSFNMRRGSAVSQSLQEPVHSWARRRLSINDAAHASQQTEKDGFGRTQSVVEGFGRTQSVAEGFGRTQSVAEGFGRTQSVDVGTNYYANDGHMTDRSSNAKDPDVASLQRRGNVVVRTLLMRPKTVDTNKSNQGESNFSSSSRKFKSLLNNGKAALPKRNSEGANLPPVLNRISQGISSLKARVVAKVNGKPKDPNHGRRQSAPEEPITFGRTSSAP